MDKKKKKKGDKHEEWRAMMRLKMKKKRNFLSSRRNEKGRWHSNKKSLIKSRR